MLLRKAFTLLELLVAVGIISILLAMLAPVVQKVREASHRVQCLNNLKQFGIALHHYAADQSRLPPGGRVRNFPIHNDGQTPLNTVWLENQGSWLLHVLPYMEQTTLFQSFSPFLQDDHWVGNVPRFGGCPDPADICTIRRANRGQWYAIPSPPIMRCPSYSHDYADWHAVTYAGSVGPQCIWGPCGHDPYLSYCDQPKYGIRRNPYYLAAYGTTINPADVRGCFNRVGAPIGLKDVKDGTANTILVGEFSPQELITTSAFYSYQAATGHWLDANAGYGHAHTLVPINYSTHIQKECNPANSPSAMEGEFGEAKAPTSTDQELLEHSWQNYNLSQGFKARHPGGANFLFADGSVRFIDETIDHLLYQFLGCRNDGQIVEE